MTGFLDWMERLATPTLYLLLGVGAGVENVLPAIPADTFVALGGFLSAVGRLSATWVFFVTWTFNVASALAMYRLGYVRGRKFFESPWGRRLLKAHQLERMSVFYARWGTGAIFFTRFLPGIRSVVPVFAGVTHQGWLLVAVPIALASAIWYGGLVWIGAWAGYNLDRLGELLDGINLGLGLVALVLLAAAFAWWWRSRRPPTDS